MSFIIYSDKATNKENALVLAKHYFGQVNGTVSEGGEPMEFHFAGLNDSARFHWLDLPQLVDGSPGMGGFTIPGRFAFEIRKMQDVKPPPKFKDWQPKERASLCFISQSAVWEDGQLKTPARVLLMKKKRGLGAGKINAPGGHIEDGETAMEAAIRETQEEIGVTPLNLEERGELHFQFTDGFSMHCTVFLAQGFTGEPVETNEGAPMWFQPSSIPYDKMWEDDKFWLPAMLRGQNFIGWFEMEKERMLTHHIVYGTTYRA